MKLDNLEQKEFENAITVGVSYSKDLMECGGLL